MNEAWQKTYDILKTILVILLVVVLGLAAINQTITYYYHNELLQKPCELCANLNKPQTNCIASCFQQAIPMPQQSELPPIQVVIR